MGERRIAMGALSSIPLCSRGGEGDVDTNMNRPEKLEAKVEAIVVQPETVNHQGDEEEKKSVETPADVIDDVVVTESGSEEKIGVLDEGAVVEVSKEEEIISSHKQDEDGNEEVSLDDDTGEVDDEISELQDLEKPVDPQISGLSSEEEAYSKTPTMLDTTSAITNMLSEIVMESDSREVVGR